MTKDRHAHLALVASSEAAARHHAAHRACAIERHKPRRRRLCIGPAAGIAAMLAGAVLIGWGLWELAEWAGLVNAAASVAGPLLAVATGPVIRPPREPARDTLADLARLRDEAAALRADAARAEAPTDQPYGRRRTDRAAEIVDDMQRTADRLQALHFACGMFCGCVLMACALMLGQALRGA